MSSFTVELYSYDYDLVELLKTILNESKTNVILIWLQFTAIITMLRGLFCVCFVWTWFMLRIEFDLMKGKHDMYRREFSWSLTIERYPYTQGRGHLERKSGWNFEKGGMTLPHFFLYPFGDKKKMCKFFFKWPLPY